MTVEEERLSNWLHDVTPDPDRVISVEDVASRVRRRPRPPVWLPVLAAACVVGVVAALVFALRGRPPAAPAVPETPSPTPTSTVTPTPTVTHPSLRIHPWSATLVQPIELDENSLVAHGGSLYGESGDGGALVRIDPATGSVAARVTIRSTGSPFEATFADGLVWVASVDANSGGVDLDKYDPASLADRGTLSLGRAGEGHPDSVELAASPDGATLFVGASGAVSVVAPASGTVEHTRHLGGTVSGISEAPDGSVLYVAYGPQGAQRVIGLDPSTLAVKTRLDNAPFYGLGGLVATSTGFFVTNGSGFSDYVEFVRAADPTHPVAVNSGGGGDYPMASVSGRVALAGGPYAVVCADPKTGTVRAKAALPGKHGVPDVSGLTVLRGRVYAIYHGADGDGGGLIELHPPAACGLS